MSLAISIGLPTLTFVVGKVGGKFLDNLMDKFINRSRLSFYDASIVYCYSHYDRNGSHLKEGGNKMIYQVRCTATIHNSSKSPGILRDIKVIANVNGNIIPLKLWDDDLGHWTADYTVPPQHLKKMSWNAIVPGLGLRNSTDAMIHLEGPTDLITFKISYLNGRGKRQSVRANIAEVRMLNPELIVNN